MTIDDAISALLAIPTMGRPALSPDGRYVAWTWYRKAPAADVYLAPTDGTAPPRRLTATPSDTYLVSWAPDSASLVVAEDRDGDERVQLFRLTLDGAMAPLTEPGPHFFARGGMLDPSGRFLIFAANFDPETGAEIAPSWVIRQDLSSGERVAIARPKAPNAYAPSLDHAGKQVLYTRRDLDPAGTQVWLVDLDGRDDREILNFGPAVKVSASWFPDSRRVLFTAETPSHKRLGIYHIATGAIEWLIDNPDRGIESARVPLLGGRVIVTEVREARSRATLLDPVTRAEQPVEAAAGTLIPLGGLTDGAWLGLLYAARQPDQLIRFTPRPARLEVGPGLTQPLAESRLKRSDLTAPDDVRWRSVDGRRVQGWLYRPKEKPRGLVVQVHGGPTAHSEDALSAFIQACVLAGFAVLDPNYRGSTGFGLAFREAIREDGWGGREQDDIRTGIEAMLARGVIEPGRVGITGTSYGGYSSWCAITRWPREIVAAAAPICGMTDLVVDYHSTRPDLRPYSEEMLGGSPDQVPEKYRDRSPINFVDRIRGRLLIVQGMNDPNVTPENLHAVEAALQRAGVGYDKLLFADEGHGIRKPANLRVLYKRLIEFFSDAFGAAAE